MTRTRRSHSVSEAMAVAKRRRSVQVLCRNSNTNTNTNSSDAGACKCCRRCKPPRTAALLAFTTPTNSHPLTPLTHTHARLSPTTFTTTYIQYPAQPCQPDRRHCVRHPRAVIALRDSEPVQALRRLRGERENHTIYPLRVYTICGLYYSVCGAKYVRAETQHYNDKTWHRNSHSH